MFSTQLFMRQKNLCTFDEKQGERNARNTVVKCRNSLNPSLKWNIYFSLFDLIFFRLVFIPSSFKHRGDARSFSNKQKSCFKQSDFALGPYCKKTCTCANTFLKLTISDETSPSIPRRRKRHCSSSCDSYPVTTWNSKRNWKQY